MDEGEHPGEEDLVSRAPTPQDLADLCRTLNDLETRYVVVGGFAIRGAGYGRETMDVDLIVATDPENEAKVYKALESLPDKAVLERLRRALAGKRAAGESLHRASPGIVPR